jgi:hypothetical protein
LGFKGGFLIGFGGIIRFWFVERLNYFMLGYLRLGDL